VAMIYSLQQDYVGQSPLSEVYLIYTIFFGIVLPPSSSDSLYHYIDIFFIVSVNRWNKKKWDLLKPDLGINC